MGLRHRAVRTFLLIGVAALLTAGCSSDGADDQAGSTPGEGTSTTVAGNAPGAADIATGEFSLLSYNVAALPQEISGENPGNNIPLISPMLDPFDIVVSQEDFDWWGPIAEGFDFVNYHDRLRSEVTHEYQSTQHPGPDAVDLDVTDRQVPYIGDGLGMLSRFPIDGDARVPWDGCFGGIDTSDEGAADCLAMKGFQMTRVTLADGVVVDLYNLHGEAGGSEKDQALQADDYRQLAAYIEAESAGHAVILGGDTNLHTDLEHPEGADGADTEIWDRFLQTTGLADVCTSVDCDEPARIDKIAFRSNDEVELTALSHQFHGDEFVNGDGEALSDHEPLSVDFRWTQR